MHVASGTVTNRRADEANLPIGSKAAGDYEIWFTVILEPGQQRAYWLRYTRFRPASPAAGEEQAMLWAAVFDAAAAAPARGGKRIVPIDALMTDPSRFCVRIGDAKIGRGRLRGEVAGDVALSWDLHFEPAEKPCRRTSRLLGSLPVPVHAHHAHCDVRFDGEVIVDGEARAIVDAIGTQIHIHGTKRLQELRWVYVPRVGGDDGWGCELTSAKLGGSMPAVNALWMGAQGLSSMTSLCSSPAIVIDTPRSGMVWARATRLEQRVVLRSWASPEQFVGYRYRDPKGTEVPVAQSDIASCSVEVFERRGLRWHPHRTFVSDRGCALEIHGPKDMEGFSYLPWEASRGAVAPPVEHRENATATRPKTPPRVFAFGLTYREHARELGGSQGKPALFDKDPRSWAPDTSTVAIPSSDTMLAALENLDPPLVRVLRARLGFLPAMMDYEVELGIQLLEAVTLQQLESGYAPRVGYFVANDLTARSLQILGEGQSNRLAYWNLAKSSPGFLPVGSLWVPPDGERQHLPSLTLRTWVNSELRQQCATDELSLTLSQLLQAAAVHAGGTLQEHDMILSGTPGGVALSVPRWKRWLGERFLDQVGRLEAAISSYSGSRRFCGVGDVVEVDGEFLGRRRVILEYRPPQT